jgi:chemotaxis signal transduction protein
MASHATGHGTESTTPAGSGLCAFWLGGRCLGLDVSLVGEVVAIQSATPVPLAEEAIRGVFNLRGAPVVVLELAEVLKLERDETRSKMGLVLRIGDIVAAAQIDRMEAVIPAGRGVFTARDPAGDHPAVLGFLDDRETSGRVITVLDPAVLIERLEALRYISDSGE